MASTLTQNCLTIFLPKSSKIVYFVPHDYLDHMLAKFEPNRMVRKCSQFWAFWQKKKQKQKNYFLKQFLTKRQAPWPSWECRNSRFYRFFPNISRWVDYLFPCFYSVSAAKFQSKFYAKDKIKNFRCLLHESLNSIF